MKKEKKGNPPAGPGAKVNPPKGWRRLRQNEFLRKGDKLFGGEGTWYLTMAIGSRASAAGGGVLQYIRKVRKARAK